MADDILSRQLTAYGLGISIWPGYPKKRFIIFSQGRTGSSLLQNLLNKHPDIFCDREILNASYAGRILFPSLYVNGRSKTAAMHKKIFYGCKMSVYQLLREQKISSYERFLYELYREGWIFIHLKRRNIIKQGISAMMAQASKIFYSKAQNRINKIKINCDQLLNMIKTREIYLAEEEKIMENITHLPLVYEDDLLSDYDHQRAVDKVCRCIGARPYPVKADLVKLSSDDISENVANYEELYQCFKDTKYAVYLK